MILSLNELLILPSGQVDFWDMPRNPPNGMVERGYHLSPKIVSSVRGFRWKIPISMSLGVSSLPSLAACTSAFRALPTRLWVARWPSCAPSYSPAVRSRRANSLIAPGSRVPASPISYAPSRPRAGSSEHSKTDRRRVHVTVTDKGFQDLEIKRREFENRTAAFLEQLGETDTQEMVRLLRRANEIIDRNQERRDAE